MRLSIFAHAIVATIALSVASVAGAQPLPSQQLTVAAANGYGNSIYGLTLNGPLINGSQSINSDGASHGIFDALVWVPNSYTGTRDLIVADAAKGQIVRYWGPNYGTSNTLFSWTRRGSGPAHPIALSADAAGNVYIASSSCGWDPSPSLWVLPFNASNGSYGAPILIDKTFGGVKTLVLAEVQVAGSAASPAWNAGDLLVLVGDTFNARVIVYSQAAIQGVLANPAVPLTAPSATLVSKAQFGKLLALPVGMDIWPADATHGVSLLFSTLDGRILRFDTSASRFVADFADGVGAGLQKLKVGSFASTPYAFVAQVSLPSSGRILQFGAPPTSGANAPLASVVSGVRDPIGLAVTSSGSVLATSCIAPNSCSPMGSGFTLQLSGPGTANIPQNATFQTQMCLIQNDPRVTVNSDGWSCAGGTLDVANFCPNFPHTVLPPYLCGHSGASGSALAVVEASAVAIDQNANNVFMQTYTDPNQFLPGPYNLSCPQGPKFAWAPRSDLPTIEGVIVEDQVLANTFIDLTGLCDGGGGNHHILSMMSFGLGYNTQPSGMPNGIPGRINDELTFLTQTLTAASTQISSDVYNQLQTYASQAQGYFNNQNYDCALNTIATADSYLRSNLSAFSFAQPPGGNPNPAGEVDARLANQFLSIAMYETQYGPNSTWPTANVPTCNAVTLVSISVTPANPNVYIQATQQFTATGYYSDDSTQDLTGTATWSTVDQSIATVTSGGLATCGTIYNNTLVTASVGDISGSTNIYCYQIQ